MAKRTACYRQFLPCVFLISACTVDVNPSASAVVSTDTQAKKLAVKFQRQSSYTDKTLIEITDADLRPGDLLFSSSIGVTSFGIRAFSTSSVSHVAVYLGNGKIGEATGAGVQIVTLEHAMKHSDKLFALRVSDLTPQQSEQIKTFTHKIINSGYNYRGIIEFIPFMMTRQICSLNPFSENFRQQCVSGLAQAQLSDASEGEKKAWFCSEFVIDAFAQAGHPLTMAQAGWISPSDLMHMREGDITAFKSETRLQYVGHLKLGIYIKASRFVGLTR